MHILKKVRKYLIMLYFNANLCSFFTFIYFFTISEGKCLRLVLEENNVLALQYLVKICGLYVRKRGVCGYGYIHRYPRKICGYGYEYGWEISYPRQAWEKCDWRHSMAHPHKHLYRRKNLAEISYASRVIVNFVSNFVAMATELNGGQPGVNINVTNY